MAVKKNELTLDELNNIAGGRKFYEEEWDDYYNANNALTSKLRRLKAQGKAEEARQIRQACEDLFNKWMEDVHTSPEGSDPISYRSYIEQYLDQLTCGTVPIVALLNVKKNSKLLPETVPDRTTDNTAQTAVKEILTAMKEKEMLKDETLEEVTGGVIPKEIEEGLLDFARNWAYLLYVGDGISRRSRDNIKFHTRNCWGCGEAELDMFSYFEKMHVYDVTQEEFVDFVWEHRNEIPYIGQLRIKAG